MGKYKDLSGNRYGRLVVLGFEVMNKHSRSMWSCECDCGNKTVVDISNLKWGSTFSCGCLRNENRTKHGMHLTPTYRSWACMIQRCTNPKTHGYESYGGRGITICKQWFVFENFYSDMGVMPEGKTIDRIDNNEGYSPDNCRWATKMQQSNNTRINHFIEYKGKRLTVSQWDRELGGRPSLVASRLKNGWSEEEAVSISVN